MWFSSVSSQGTTMEGLYPLLGKKVIGGRYRFPHKKLSVIFFLMIKGLSHSLKKGYYGPQEYRHRTKYTLYLVT